MNDYIIIILNVLGQADPQKYAQDIVKVFSDSMGSEVKIIVITTTTQPTSVQVCPNKFIVTAENLASMQIMCETMKANVLQAINNTAKSNSQIVASSNVSFEGVSNIGYNLNPTGGDDLSSQIGDTYKLYETNCDEVQKWYDMATSGGSIPKSGTRESWTKAFKEMLDHCKTTSNTTKTFSGPDGTGYSLTS